MSVFGKLKRTEDLEEATDVAGGSSRVTEAGVYTCTINHAYVKESKSGAIGVQLDLVTSDGRDLKKAVYVTSGHTKGGTHFYVKDNKKHPLPGFTFMNDLCRITADIELFELETSEVDIMVYDFDSKKEVKTSVDMLTDLVGETVQIGVAAILEDNFSNPTESRINLDLAKVFDVDTDRIMSEIEAEADEATFKQRWIDGNVGEDKMRDKRKLSKGAAAPGSTTKEAAKPKRASAFGKK